jgi:hypothetical protein
MVFDDTNNSIFGMRFQLIAGNLTAATALPRPLGTGTSPKLSILGDLGQGVFSMLVSDSYCWNSEVKNKRIAPALCDSVANSNFLVTSYTVGLLQDLIASLSPSPPDAGMLLMSPCHPRMMHGVVATGSDISGSIMLPVAIPDTLVVTGSMMGVSDMCNSKMSPDAADCGCSLPYVGAVDFAFTLPLP